MTTQAVPVAVAQQFAALQQAVAPFAAMAAQAQRALAPLARQLDAVARAVEQTRRELARRAQVRLRAGQVTARRRFAALCAVAVQLWLRLPGERRRPSSTVLLAAYRSNAPNGSQVQSTPAHKAGHHRRP